MNELPPPRPFFETPHWTVSLNRNQTYLGRAAIVLKRSCGDLAEITDAENQDFIEIVRRLERAYRRALGVTMFNWSCLMNFAYRNDPPDPQVHWHVVPRYDHPVSFRGGTYADPNFGERSVSTITTLDDATMEALEATLAEAFKAA